MNEKMGNHVHIQVNEKHGKDHTENPPKHIGDKKIAFCREKPLSTDKPCGDKGNANFRHGDKHYFCVQK